MIPKIRGRPALVPALLGGSGLLLSLLSSIGCKRALSDEEQVRAVIRKAVSAANDKEAAGVVEDTAPGFKGPGGADVAECRRILTGYFLQQGWLKVFERGLEVNVEGAKASAELDALVARGTPVESVEDILPKQASRLVFELQLEKNERGWAFSRASYRQRPLVER